jgi:polysaccharide export outer membrane protein
MRILTAFFLTLLLFFGASCRVQKATGINYLENVTDTTTSLAAAPPETLIQKGDLLSVRVYSMSINPLTDAPYNLPEAGAASGSGTIAPVSGFLVDQKGNIEYPRIGTLQAEGLTKEGLADLIKARLQGQLNQPSVIVRFLNYRVTVLGEVRSPGTYTVPTDRVNVLEALGLAGDITEFGNRASVKVLRESNGRREIATLNLSSANVFSSPYYYLQQNDKVIVEQTGRRLRQQEQQNIAQQIGIGTAIITALALILNFIK